MSEAKKISVKALICEGKFAIRSVRECDIETLRIWKNAHKEFFFLKTEITKAMQKEWYRVFSARQNDHMFVVLDSNKYVGCIGARYQDDYVDLYNIILGDKEFKGKHVMVNALWSIATLSNQLYTDKPIRVRVLESNPAVNWYKKIGFVAFSVERDFVNMELDWKKITCQYSFSIEN